MQITRRTFAAGALAASASPSALAQAPLMIDTHAHIFERGLPLAPGARYTSDYDAKVGDYLKQLDDNGMSHGVLVQISFLGTDNSYILNGIKASGGRLRGIAVVEPTIAEADMRALDAQGIVGVRLNLVGRPIPTSPKGLGRTICGGSRRWGWQVGDPPRGQGPRADRGAAAERGRDGRGRSFRTLRRGARRR